MTQIRPKILFKDHETTSNQPKEYGNNPYKGHRICGTSFTWDDHPYSYYVPIRCQAPGGEKDNIPLDNYIRWHRDALLSCGTWVNHNVKFDANFSLVETGLNSRQLICPLIDTVVAAKLLDSDRGFGGTSYSLDSLAADWLKQPINHFEDRLKAFFKGLPKGHKDYGLLPVDLIGLYACCDVETNRRLYLYLCDRMPEDVGAIWNIEKQLTSVLLDMEYRGIRTSKTLLLTKQLQLYIEIADILEKLKSLVGHTFNPKSNPDCFDVLCNQFGLPVLEWTNTDKESKLGDDFDPLIDNEEGCNPSFNKHALAGYLQLYEVTSNEKIFKTVKLISEYRSKLQLSSLFVEPFLDLIDDNGVLHPTYNQLVRTGRMSCRNPNAQQQTKESKALILPFTEKNSFLSTDASQIEFRLIVHYINDLNAIAAYAENPDSDFHTWVAKMCGTKRGAGKTLNFTMAYGGGKAKVLSKLETDKDLLEELLAQVKKMGLPADQEARVVAKLAKERAETVFRTYHDTLPGLKKLMGIAGNNLKRYGYAFNMYGRRRHLPAKFAFKAFNSVIQGFASDIIKGQMIKMAPRYNSYIRDLGIDISMNVHDEITWDGPTSVLSDPRVQANIVTNLEEPFVPLRVPIRFGCGLSNKSWAHASDDKKSYEKDGYGTVNVQRELADKKFSMKIEEFYPKRKVVA